MQLTSHFFQAFRETSWQFAGVSILFTKLVENILTTSEQSETRSERELSEEPPSSYDEEVDMDSHGNQEEAGQ
jgi:nuclear pore complex protein Nup107